MRRNYTPGVRNSASRDGAQTSEFGRDRTKISAGRAIIVELDGLSCALGVPQAPANSLPKRAFDIAGAIFLLLFLAPLLGLLAIAVFWDCGPVLSGHRRVGAGGRLFTCWKFRSMVVDAEAALARTLAVYPQALLDWERDYKLRSDPRVTPLGRFLRSSSLDELPQLFSVIIGDMSLIGPRPIAVGEIRRYGAAFRDYATCRPGITGLSQVSGRNATSYDARIAIDSQYARSWSFRGDLVILFRTVGVVLRRRGDQ